MPVSAKTGFDSLLYVESLTSGIPLMPAVRARPTINLLAGKTKEGTVQGGMGGVKFSGNKLDPGQKFLNIPILSDAGTLTQLTTANQSALRTGEDAQVGEMREVQTASAVIQFNLTREQIKKGQGKGWNAEGSFEQWVAKQTAIKYANATSALALSSRSAAGVPQNGQLGSIPTQITDGQTNAARGFGSEDAAFGANFLNGTRTSEFYSVVQNGGGAAMSETLGRTMALELSTRTTNVIYAPMSLPRYSAFVGVLRTAYGKYELNQEDREKLNLGNTRAIELDGVIYYAESSIATGITYQIFFDAEAISYGFNVDDAELMKDTNKNAVMQLDTFFDHQLVVHAPHKCGIIMNLSSV